MLYKPSKIVNLELKKSSVNKKSISAIPKKKTDYWNQKKLNAVQFLSSSSQTRYTCILIVYFYRSKNLLNNNTTRRIVQKLNTKINLFNVLML